MSSSSNIFCFGTNVNKIKGTVKTIAFDKICHNTFVTQDYDIFYNIAQVFCARIRGNRIIRFCRHFVNIGNRNS